MVLHTADSFGVESVNNLLKWRFGWGIPVFVMISGALFLEHSANYDIKRIYSRNIKKMLIAFLIWVPFYDVVCCAVYNNFSVRNFLVNARLQHLWFLLMISGLYMIVPFLREITKSKPLTKYFLILSLIFAFIIPQVLSVIAKDQSEISRVLNNFIKCFYFYFTLGYVGYFVLGHMLDKSGISVKFEIIIYILGVISVIFFGSRYGDYFSLNTLAVSTAIFVFFKKHSPNGTRANKILKFISSHCFGIYLLHSLFCGISGHFNGILEYFGIPNTAFMVFIASFVLAFMCKKIPVIKNIIP